MLTSALLHVFKNVLQHNALQPTIQKVRIRQWALLLNFSLCCLAGQGKITSFETVSYVWKVVIFEQTIDASIRKKII